ncbi:MAG TPA: FGGY-family carbohydrate kinase [Thermoclostridium caenicola]|uniref:xylulokinase n=1 Tax=Thermoclostridium caenicola TaxID=659425 RepID=UPI002BF8DB43|nr:FGGY-family carbohydrate kinase [Thermoclostridium caenicola]HPO78044.1 FGGY-family carbohydrate kinase [Thermoclostridium caenicola]
MSYTLGIDIGTTNVKSVLFGEGPRAVADASYEYPTTFPAPSWAQQNPEHWWEGAKATIRSVLSQSGIDPADIKAVAISCQSPCALLVDRNGNPLHDALIWMDRRSTEELELLEQSVGAQRIFEITGNRLDTYFMLSELMWLKRHHPELLDKTYKILQANGYVNLKLTGEFTIDSANLSLTQANDLKHKCWSRELLDAIGVDMAITPDVYDCGEVIGTVTRQAAEQTGLKEGTPVLAGSVDATAAAFEAGVQQGIALEMTGTSSVMLIGLDKPLTTIKLSHLNGFDDSTHYLYGAMSSAGGSLKWFRDALYGVEAGERNVYARMDTEVERDAPEPTHLLFLPYMVGERAPIWNPDARGVFFGLSMGTTRAQMIRAIMEGAAFALLDNLEEAEKIGLHPEQLYVVGGCSNSDIWLRIKASVINREIIVPRDTLGANGGLACLMAAYTGEFETPGQAAAAGFKVARRIEPVPAWVERYRALYREYKKLYESLEINFKSFSLIGSTN